MGLGRSEEATQSFATALAELRQLPLERRRSLAMSRLETRLQEGMAGSTKQKSETKP
jgi:hypothetical protein